MGGIFSSNDKKKDKEDPYTKFIKSQDKEGKLQMLSDALSLNPSHFKRLVKLFKDIDVDESGMISLDEFYEFLNMPDSPFFNRVFAAMDTDRVGDSFGNLDIAEFLLGLINFCLLPAKLMPAYMFSMYDIDGSGEIDLAELQTMIIEIHGWRGEKQNVQRILEIFDTNGDQLVDRSEFIEVEKRAQSLLMPLMNLQYTLKFKTLGTMWWDWLQQTIYKRMERERCRNVHELLEKYKKEPPMDPSELGPKPGHSESSQDSSPSAEDTDDQEEEIDSRAYWAEYSSKRQLDDATMAIIEKARRKERFWNKFRLLRPKHSAPVGPEEDINDSVVDSQLSIATSMLTAEDRPAKAENPEYTAQVINFSKGRAAQLRRKYALDADMRIEELD